MSTSKKSIVGFVIAQEFLKNVAGEMAVDLVRICEKKQGRITDEELAQKLKLKVTEVRTILNRLHYRGIAGYQKTKNKKTGWYAYTWAIKSKRIAELIIEQQEEKIQKAERKIELESNYVFFNCKNACDSIPFEIAAEYHFKCPTCGNTMGPAGGKRKSNKIKKEMDLIREELVGLSKTV